MIKVQVLIIGGGVMGVSLAYHLVKEGWKDILLAEKNDLTHGSTWHAAGLCTHFAHNPTVQELRATSVRLYRDILPEETGRDCGFHRSGAMRITRNPDRMDEFRHVAGLSEFTGYPFEILTKKRIAELHPLARLDGLLGGIYEPDDGHVDPTLATTAMAEVARRGGAQIWRNCPVINLRCNGSHWIAETSNGDVHATHVVNAAGTWGWEVGKMMGLEVPSVPVLHQYLVTDTVQEVADRKAKTLPELPIIRDPEESWYVRQEGDGFILGPYEKDAQVWSVDGVPPEFGADLLPADLDRVEHIVMAAMKRIPALGSGGIKSVVNGPITFTPDANPLIGPAHGLPNAWLLTGSSMGVMEGGGSGWFLAHWMTHGSPPLDPLAVDSRRFGLWADRDYRVSKAIESFGLQFGVHYPYEERPAGRGLRLSPLHNLMVERGAVMGCAHGWERPNWFGAPGDKADDTFGRANWFSSVASEVRAAMTGVSMADLSVFSKFDVKGSEVSPYLEALGANRAPKSGRIGLTHVLTPAGGIVTEFTVTRLAEHHAYLTSAAAAEGINLDILLELAAEFDVQVRNTTEEFGVIGVMGPKASEILPELDDMNWLTVRETSIAETPVRALRVSYIGEAGWELHVASNEAAQLFVAVEESAQKFGLGFYGAYAANSMRLEKGYRAWGSDLTTERSPLEAGLGTFVRPGVMDRLIREEEWDMVLLEIEAGKVDPFYAHTVWQDSNPVGIVTSGAFGHRTGKSLALAYMRDNTARSELTVSLLGEHRPATILSQAPYDPDNTLMKSGGQT